MRVTPQARQEATEWFVLLREQEPQLPTREAFYIWLRRSPDNIHAYLRVLALWEDTELLGYSDLFDREQLLARAQAEPANLEVLRPKASGLTPNAAGSMPQASGFRFQAWLFAASVILVIALGGAWYFTQHNTYATAIGEQRTVALADGSTIVLGPRSSVRTRFSEQRRDIDLLHGQAIFRVAHNPARPFVVHSGTTEVTAVGTQFDVYRRNTGTTVTVLEGRVAVLRTQESGISELLPASLVLTAGEQINVSPHTRAAPVRMDPQVATAWTQGKLVFDETPLADVITEFNRYSTRQLIVDDPQLRNFHISGVFPSSDPTRVAELLQARFGVKVLQTDDEIRIVRE